VEVYSFSDMNDMTVRVKAWRKEFLLCRYVYQTNVCIVKCSLII